ncbi:ADP-ribosyltransferase [Streptococcus salivarius]
MYESKKSEENKPESWKYYTLDDKVIASKISKILNKDFGNFFDLNDETKEKLEPINNYLPAYNKYNSYLRDNKTIDKTKDEVIEGVSDILSEFNLKETIILFRGCTKEILDLMKSNASNLENNENYLLDPSFLSTTILEEKRFCPENQFPKHTYQLRIFAPKGTQAFYVGDLIGEGSRKEVLLQKNTILQILSESKDNLYIDCLVLPKEKQIYWS